MAVRRPRCLLSYDILGRCTHITSAAPGGGGISLPAALAHSRPLPPTAAAAAVSLPPPQGLPPRKADPGRIRIHEQMPEGAKQDAEYLKMVQDVSSRAKNQRRLASPSAPLVASCRPRAAPPLGMPPHLARTGAQPCRCKTRTRACGDACSPRALLTGVTSST
jgi:hypothetical protein